MLRGGYLGLELGGMLGRTVLVGGSVVGSTVDTVTHAMRQRTNGPGLYISQMQKQIATQSVHDYGHGHGHTGRGN